MERREFLKNSGIVGAATAAGIISTSYGSSYLHELAPGGRNVSRTTGVPRIPIPTTCMLCKAKCGIIGYLEDNRLVKIEGNPRDPNSRGKICSVGISGLQYLYNPERVLTPLKRTGYRGENKWKKISWDDAINEISAKIKSVMDSDKTEQFIIMKNLDSAKSITDGFINAVGHPTVIEHEDIYHFFNKKFNIATFGAEEVIPDIANSKYILNFGGNPYEHNEYYVPFISRLIDSRMDGARLVTFDTRITNSSGKSSEWYALNPGSEIFIALSMVNVIMQRGLYDAEFIGRYTDSSAKEIADLSGRFTPELAESVSGIKESHIRRIAIEFASSTPAIAIFGDFGDYEEKELTYFAIQLLNIITGNVEEPGGLFPQIPLLKPNGKGIKDYTFNPEFLFYNINDGKTKAEILMNIHSNPLFTYPETDLIEAVLKDESRIPYHVVVDSFITETALYADIILPAATYLESWGLHSPVSFELSPQVVLQQPLVNPRGESEQFHQIFIDIAGKLGEKFQKNFPVDKIENFIRADAVNYEGLLKQEGGFENLRETGLWTNGVTSHQNNFFKSGFPTANKKININYLLKKISSFDNNIYGNQNLKENEFILLLYQSSVQPNELSAESMWLSEIEHTNFVWLNKSSAEKIGIRDGDSIKLTSWKNSINGKARLTNGIHPKSAAMNKFLGHWALGNIAQGKNFKSDNPNTSIIWWEEGTLQPHPLKLISYSIYHDDNLYKRNNIVRIEKL